MAGASRLIVTEAFGDYVPGDRITGPQAMDDVLASHPQHVMREAVPQEPEVVGPPEADQKPPRPSEGAPTDGEPAAAKGVNPPQAADPAPPGPRTAAPSVPPLPPKGGRARG